MSETSKEVSLDFGQCDQNQHLDFKAEVTCTVPLQRVAHKDLTIFKNVCQGWI